MCGKLGSMRTTVDPNLLVRTRGTPSSVFVYQIIDRYPENWLVRQELGVQGFAEMSDQDKGKVNSDK